MDKDLHQVKFENLVGEEMLVTFKLIKRKMARQVFNKTSRMVLHVLTGLGLSQGDGSIGDALDALDYDKSIDPLARALLNGMVVALNPDEPADHIRIDDIDETDFFDGRQDELYLFMYHAFVANFPKELARLKQTIAKRLGMKPGELDEKVSKIMAKITG